MTFDIENYTDEQLEKMTNVQMQLLRNAQTKKDNLKVQLDQDIQMWQERLFANGLRVSSVFAQKKNELIAEYERKVAQIKDQMLFAISINEPEPGYGEGDETVGYVVDYSLPYADRYHIVREYYLSISDPVERMTRYKNDEVARRYLGTYYSTLYDVLNAYSIN